MPEIVIIGGGGHAKVITAILKRLPDRRVLGYTDREDRGPLLDLPWLGSDEQLEALRARHPGCEAVLGIGMVRPEDSSLRRRLAERLSDLGFLRPAIIAPGAIVNEDVQIGDGTVVMDGAVINSGTIIGEGCILNTSCSVDHDCRIGSFVHIAPSATLSGGVAVGDNAMIGVGSTVSHSISITADVLVGAGSTVVQNIEKPGTYIGSPATMT